jgi:heme oxygenase
MGEIKSAREIAIEKMAGLGEATEEERLRWKYVPEGSRLAARYIAEDCNLVLELGKYNEKIKEYIIEGLSDILIRNIGLPDSDLAKKRNRRAMDGLKAVKKNQVGLENVYSKIRRIFDHHQDMGEQQRNQAYLSLKTEFEAQVRQALQQQMGSLMGVQIDVEKQPQFQTEWRRRLAQLDSEYLKLLGELRQELAAIS